MAARRKHRRSRINSLFLTTMVSSAIAFTLGSEPLAAQDAAGGWQTGTSVEANSSPPETQSNTETKEPDAPGQLVLTALLTVDGQRIEKDVIWRIFRAPDQASEIPQLLSAQREAEPSLRLPPGRYIVNSAFGRAHLTREIELKSGDTRAETFVLNAGGLRLHALVANSPVDHRVASYEIYDGERDQSGNRSLIMSRAKPGLIIRLNAGIYHIVSRYGDANAQVRADITVEAGKLTEATVSHAAARIAFKLVESPGGEALPGTRWTIMTAAGDLVKRSVGALPSHVLAPGDYVATASRAGKTYQQAFSVTDGQTASVEVLRQ